MTHDLDLDREPDRPVHLDWDEAVEHYEHGDAAEFEAEMLDTLCGTATLPEPLRAALVTWYRTTDEYQHGVQYVIDTAAGR